MKKSDALYLSAREAAAELAISPATLYAYVSRGLVRSEPSTDSRSHRYRAEDIRGLKERRAPSPEPRGLRSFDADLPVLDSAICTITEDGPIYRGVNCVDLAEKDTLEHAATLLWDVTVVDPFAAGQLPARLGRHAHDRRSRASRRADRPGDRGAGARCQRRSARLYPCRRRPRHGRRAHFAPSGRNHAQHRGVGGAAASCRSRAPGRATTSMRPT